MIRLMPFCRFVKEKRPFPGEFFNIWVLYPYSSHLTPPPCSLFLLLLQEYHCPPPQDTHHSIKPDRTCRGRRPRRPPSKIGLFAQGASGMPHPTKEMTAPARRGEHRSSGGKMFRIRREPMRIRRFLPHGRAMHAPTIRICNISRTGRGHAPALQFNH